MPVPPVARTPRYRARGTGPAVLGLPYWACGVRVWGVPTAISAGPPVEAPRCQVGRTSTVLVDTTRADRSLAVECWYPADDSAVGAERSVYELLPGVGFAAGASTDALPVDGAHPLVVWSHGRTGTRTAYVMLCEGLAARGYIVVAADHPGDTLLDWMTGTAVDDETNESQRDADVRFVLDAVLAGSLRGPDGVATAPAIDAERIAVAGHSYGAHTSFALAGAATPDPRIRAVAGLQSLTRNLSRRVLARVAVPALMIVGARDQTTPPSTDADRAFAALRGDARSRFDIDRAGHQACSDVGLYQELVSQVDGLPDIVSDYVRGLADQVTGRAGDPWRPTVGAHLEILGAWLDDVFDRDRTAARATLDTIATRDGITRH